ncbi:MAG: hypothetical protein CMF72_00860 [Mameliella sp.]|nr:hypothetical protein [Mameliella sp.]|tara:strand:+ start:3950 stop:7369 length:3420 start_codon:yes stop_codon:yes gene_type:complete
MGLFNHEAANRALEASDVPVQNAIRRIYLQGAASNAPVYEDPDLTIMRVSDMKSDASGYFDLCYVQDGEYRVEIESPQGDILYSADNVFVGSHLRTQELDEYNSTDQLRDDVFLSYQEVTGRYPVRPGQKILICSTDIQYKVMPADESAPQLVSAGGVKFCQTGTRYTDLGCFEHAVARGESFSAGTMVFAGGTIFSFDDDSNTNLPGLTGWRRVVSPENDANLAQAKAKTDLVSVTQPVNLDVVPALVAESNAYASVAEGLAATSDGEAFFVPTPPGLQIYRNESASAAFIGWFGDILYEACSDLLADTKPMQEALTVRTRQEGFVYRVAPGAATDHQVTTAGGVKLYVLPINGEIHIGALGLDLTGATEYASDIREIGDYATQNGWGLVFPKGRISTSSVTWNVAEGESLRCRGEPGAELQVRGNFNIQAVKRLRTTLAADAVQEARTIEIADATGVIIGDMIHIHDTTAVESGWNYRKQCIRRVQAINGATITLDQPLQFFFNAADNDWVDIYPDIRAEMRDLFVETTMSNNQLNLKAFSRIRLRNVRVEGPVPNWASGANDGLKFIYCDNTHLDDMNFKKVRYAPFIMGCRDFRITNSHFERVRHCDPNNWTENFTMEDCQGYDTQNLIQTHPCINPIYRRVRDMVTDDTDYYGIDIRGFGGLIEDCEVTHPHGIVAGNVGAPVLTLQPFSEQYHDMARSFRRTYRRVKAPFQSVRVGTEGLTIFADCDVGRIAMSQYTLEGCQIEVDAATRVRSLEAALTTPTAIGANNGAAIGAYDATIGQGFDRKIMRHQGTVPTVLQFRTRIAETPVTDVTQANPASVTTLYDHRLETGDTVAFADVEGMTELNGNTYTVTVVDDLTFTLDGTDSTGFGANITDTGMVELQTPKTVISDITQANPAVVTAAGHGYSDGNIVWINGVGGMTGINQNYYKVASATTDTFVLTDLDGANIDATSFDVYTSGGRATRQELCDTVDAVVCPQAGISPKLMIRSTLFSGNTTGKSRWRFPVKYRAFDGGNVSQSNRYGRLKVTAMSDTARSVAEYTYKYSNKSGNPVLSDNFSIIPNAETLAVNAGVENFRTHGSTENSNEGITGNWTQQNGARHYSTFDVIVDVGWFGRKLLGIVLEFEEEEEGSI